MTALSTYASPYAYILSSLGTDQDSGSVNGTWLTLNFNTDVSSFLNGIIDRPTTSRFRALRAGYYRISLKLNAHPTATQDRGWDHRILKNGVTSITDSYCRNNSADTVETRGTANSDFVIILLLAQNDYIEVQTNPLDSVVIRTQDYSSILFELVKLT